MAIISLHGGLGVFLADRNIDVWGIDLRNVQIPVTFSVLIVSAMAISQQLWDSQLDGKRLPLHFSKTDLAVHSC